MSYKATSNSLPSQHEHEKRYGAAVRRFRQEHPEAAQAAYLDADVPAAARRFLAGQEFKATWRLLRDHGFPANGRLLDLGSGNGIASFAFASQGVCVTAVEPCSGDEYGTGAIEALSRQTGVPITVVSGWGESLPFESASFDAFYVRQCLHHADCLEAVVREAGRVLKLSGLFLAVREHVVTDNTQLQRFQDKHPMHQMNVPENAYPLQRYVDAIEQAGMSIIRTLGPHSFPINMDPASIRIALGPCERAGARIFGHSLAGVFCRCGERVITSRITGRILDRVRKRPGRFYGFLARNQGCDEASVVSRT